MDELNNNITEEVTETNMDEMTADNAPETTEEPVPETTEENAPETTEEPVSETTEENAPETTEEPVSETTEENAPETTEDEEKFSEELVEVALSYDENGEPVYSEEERSGLTEEQKRRKIIFDKITTGILIALLASPVAILIYIFLWFVFRNL